MGPEGGVIYMVLYQLILFVAATHRDNIFNFNFNVNVNVYLN